MSQANAVIFRVWNVPSQAMFYAPDMIEEVLGSAVQRCNSKTWGLDAPTHMVEA